MSHIFCLSIITTRGKESPDHMNAHSSATTALSGVIIPILMLMFCLCVCICFVCLFLHRLQKQPNLHDKTESVPKYHCVSVLDLVLISHLQVSIRCGFFCFCLSFSVKAFSITESFYWHIIHEPTRRKMHRYHSQQQFVYPTLKN